MTLVETIGFRNRLNSLPIKSEARNVDIDAIFIGVDTSNHLISYPISTPINNLNFGKNVIDFKFSNEISEKPSSNSIPNITRYFMIKSEFINNIPKINLYYGSFYRMPQNSNHICGKSSLLFEFDSNIYADWIESSNDKFFLQANQKLYLVYLPICKEQSLLAEEIKIIEHGEEVSKIVSTHQNKKYDLIFVSHNSSNKISKIGGIKLGEKKEYGIFTTFKGNIKFIATYDNDILFIDDEHKVYFCSISNDLTINLEPNYKFITLMRDTVALYGNQIGSFIAVTKSKNADYHVYDINYCEKRTVLRLIEPQIFGFSSNLAYILTSKGLYSFNKLSQDFMIKSNQARAQALILRYQLLKKREDKLKQKIQNILDDNQ